jgi:hypothetical protein
MQVPTATPAEIVRMIREKPDTSVCFLGREVPQQGTLPAFRLGGAVQRHGQDLLTLCHMAFDTDPTEPVLLGLYYAAAVSSATLTATRLYDLEMNLVLPEDVVMNMAANLEGKSDRDATTYVKIRHELVPVLRPFLRWVTDQFVEAWQDVAP